MLYLIYDHATGEIVDKTNSETKAEQLCRYWEESSAYVFGKSHVFEYKLSEITV